jgi:vacuolar protein sorting-associated protein 33A
MAAVASGTPSKLSSSPLNIAALRENSKSEFETLLTSLPGGKICLVVDPKLIVPLKLIITDGSKYLREHNVEIIVELATKSLSTECSSVLYLTRPSLENMKLIATQAKNFDERRLRKHLHVAFVPRRTFICEQLLKEEGVFSDLSTSEFSLDIFPLDDDVLTMGLDSCYKDCMVSGDQSSLFYVTRALMKIQAVYGHIPNIRSKGKLAKAVLDMLLRLQREEDSSSAGGSSIDNTQQVLSGTKSGSGESVQTVYIGTRPKAFDISGGSENGPSGGTSASSSSSSSSSSTPNVSEIDTMIILDRSVDMYTPLVTPLTLEALLHEFLTIDNAMIKVDASLLVDNPDDAVAVIGKDKQVSGQKNGPALPAGSKLTLHLNSNDKLYSEIRDMNISVAGPHLTVRARELQGFRDQIKRSKDLEVSDIHKFVKAIPTLQQDLKSLRVLVELTSLMQKETNEPKFMTRWQLERSLLEEEGQKDTYEAISALISKRQPFLSVLRILCLCSAVEGGLRSKQLESFRREIVSTYGFESLFTLDNLERAGLLTTRDSGSSGITGGLGFSALTGTSSTWSSIRKSLQLTSDEAQGEGAPTDIHFVTSGYAPLSIRLVQAAITSGWGREPYSEALRQLPGPTNLIRQVRHESDNTGNVNNNESGENSTGSSRKVVLVVFVGGVTYIEISSLRFLSEKYPVDFLVLTTSIINGSSLIESLAAKLPNAISAAAFTDDTTNSDAASIASSQPSSSASSISNPSGASTKKPVGTQQKATSSLGGFFKSK